MYPFDLMKTNLMTNKDKRAADVLKQIVSTNGIRGLYKGWTMSLMKMTPTSSINFFSYELLKKLLRV